MKILILFGHPAYQNSSINKTLLQQVKSVPNVTLNDLYEEYPDMDIDIDREQQLLSEHDCIVFMFPMYWYSTPAIFKEWQDLVLEHGWAYGEKGNALKNKLFFCCVTTGASRSMFKAGELQNHTLMDFLLPIYQMSRRCKLKALPPFVAHGSHKMTDVKLEKYSKIFYKLLNSLTQDKIEDKKANEYEYLNDYIEEI